METEKSQIRLLEEFAEKTNRKVISSKDSRQSRLAPGIQDKCQYATIEDQPGNGFYYIAFDTYGTGGGVNHTYSGVFTALKLKDPDFWMEVRLKDVIDTFKGLFKKKKLRISHPSIDQSLWIDGSDAGIISNIIGESGVYSKVIELSKAIEAFRLSINKKEITHLEEFEDKPTLALYTTYDWITGGDQIEMLFALSKKILTKLKALHTI